MKAIKIVSSLFIAIIFLTFSAKSSFGATTTPTPTPAPYGKVCLNGAKMTKNTKTINGKTNHNVHLTGSGLPTDQNIYLVGCVALNDTFYCKSDSTQNNQAVAQLGFPINAFPVTIGTKTVNYDFSVDGNNNPIKAPAGTIDTYAHSQTTVNMAHSFFAVFAGESKQTPGTASSLQYGTFDLNQDAKNCVSVHWDPEGKIFDAQSLEPLPSTKISLLDSSKSKLVTAPVLKNKEDNPQYPDSDGQFNFDVLDGTYYLSPIKSGYDFAKAIANVDSHYTKAYSCDASQGYPLYLDQSKIVVNGSAVHCDVPLKSTTGKPYYAPKVTVLNYYHSRVPKTFTYQFGGQVSHPFTQISLVGYTSRQTITQTAADVDGNWDVSIDASDIPQTDHGKVDAIYTKVDLTKDQTGMLKTNNHPVASLLNRLLAFFQPQPVHAQSSVVIDSGSPTTAFEPIFPYLEGYAYDKNGAVLPNATVAVSLNNNQSEYYYKTQADANGYFSIDPDHLPLFPYRIIVIPVNSSNQIVFTTSQFAQANQPYLTKNNVDLMTATKNGTPVVTIIPKNTVTPSANAPSQTTQTQASQANTALIILLILILLLFLGGGLYLYMRKKNMSSEGGPTQMT